MEPLAVAWHAVSRSTLQVNDTVLVVGAGPIGLAIIQVLKAKGITSIIALEVSEKRRGFALSLGATEVLNPVGVDAVAHVRTLTENAGADIAFECSGVQAGLDTAMCGLRVRGTTVIVSLWEQKPVIDAFAIVLHEKHVTGAAVYDDGDFEAVINAIASGMFSYDWIVCFGFLVCFEPLLTLYFFGLGEIQPRSMITSKIRMEDVDEKGFKALIGERDKHVKILVDISA